MEKVTFNTQDKVRLVANYFAPVSSSTLGVLCLHMMPETKESWTPLAQVLSAQGLHVLAPDERGHGESTTRGGEELDYKKFSDQEQQAKRLDVDASLTWLKSHGVQLETCVVIGASIGANLALDALLRFPQLPAAVLLSPGQDYRGVQTNPAAQQLRPAQRVLYIASQDDEYSFESVERLDYLTKAPHETWRLSQAGHGTQMCTAQPQLVHQVADWVVQALRFNPT